MFQKYVQCKRVKRVEAGSVLQGRLVQWRSGPAKEAKKKTHDIVPKAVLCDKNFTRTGIDPAIPFLEISSQLIDLQSKNGTWPRTAQMKNQSPGAEVDQSTAGCWRSKHLQVSLHSQLAEHEGKKRAEGC